MNRLLPSVVISSQLAVLLTVAACSEGGTPAEPTGAEMNPVESMVGVAPAALSDADLRKYSKAALEGDGEAAFKVMTHYQMADLDRRNAEYWAQISAENGHVYGATRYASYLLDFPAVDSCRRAQFWVKRASELAADKEDVSIKEIKEDLGKKCSHLLRHQ